MVKKTIFVVSLILVMVVVSGCTSGLFNEDTETDTGQMVLSIADNAVNDLENVFVYIEQVKVHHEDTGWKTINEFEDEDNGMLKVDLLDLRFSEERLGDEILQAGKYDKIRLKLAEENNSGNGQGQEYLSRLVFKDNSEMPLKVPAGSEKGFQIDYDFTVGENALTEIVLDVDLTKLVFAGRSGKALLNTQAVSVIDKIYAGNIIGQVLGETDDQETPGEVINLNGKDVYVEAYKLEDYNEESADFVEGAEPEAISVATTVATTEAGEERDAGSFMLRGLPEGDYILKTYVGSKVSAEEDEEDEMEDEIEIDSTIYEAKIVNEAVSVTAGENTELANPIILKLKFQN